MGNDEDADKGMIDRRRLITGAGIAAAVGVTALVMAPDSAEAATAGTGSSSAIIMQSNSLGSGDALNDTPNVASSATDLDASANFGNYVAYGAYVLSVNATPANGGNIDGIRGSGRGAGVGLSGAGQVGPGVVGTSSTGYGGQFSGGKAQLRLQPGPTAGAPTSGAHLGGELYADSAGALFYCIGAGTPGTWAGLSRAAEQPVYVNLPRPERFVDTQSGLGGVRGPVASAATHVFQMTGRNGASNSSTLRIPDTATTIVGNLTVVGAAGIPAGSHLTMWPSGTRPNVINLIYGANQTLANAFTSALAASAGHGHLSVYNQHACDYILDVVGYYVSSTALA